MSRKVHIKNAESTSKVNNSPEKLTIIYKSPFGALITKGTKEKPEKPLWFTWYHIKKAGEFSGVVFNIKNKDEFEKGKEMFFNMVKFLQQNGVFSHKMLENRQKIENGEEAVITDDMMEVIQNFRMEFPPIKIIDFELIRVAVEEYK